MYDQNRERRADIVEEYGLPCLTF